MTYEYHKASLGGKTFFANETPQTSGEECGISSVSGEQQELAATLGGFYYSCLFLKEKRKKKSMKTRASLFAFCYNWGYFPFFRRPRP